MPISVWSSLRAGAYLLLVLTLLIVSAPAATPAAAQIAPVSPRVQSFAGAASDAIACGAEALAANPAALARECAGPTRMVLLPTAKATVWTSAARGTLWENLEHVLDPSSLHSEVDAADRRAILNAIGPDGLRHRQRLDIPLMQFTGRAVSGSVTFTTAARGTVARDLAELALEGSEESRLGYAIGNTRQDMQSYATLAVGHGRQFGEYDVGVTGHAMLGIGLTSWQASTPTVDFRAGSVSAELVGMFAGNKLLEGSPFDFGRPDGLGVGLDVGVQRDYGPYRVGLAVQNLVQWTSWSDELFIGRFELVATTESVSTSYETARYRGAPDERPLEDRLFEDAHFPRRLRVGAGWEGDRTSVGAGFVVSGDGRLDRDWSQLVSVGAEYRPFRALRLQTGAATSFDELHQLSLGAGVQFGGFHIDGAVSRLLGSGGAGGYTVGLGLSLSYQRRY